MSLGRLFLTLLPLLAGVPTVSGANVWMNVRMLGSSDLRSVDMLSDDYGVIVGTQTNVLQFDGSGWWTVPGAAGPWDADAGAGNEGNTNLWAVALTSPDDIWIGSQGGIGMGKSQFGGFSLPYARMGNGADFACQRYLAEPDGV